MGLTVVRRGVNCGKLDLWMRRDDISKGLLTVHVPNCSCGLQTAGHLRRQNVHMEQIELAHYDYKYLFVFEFVFQGR